MPILSDFTVDRVVPLELDEGIQPVAFLRPGGGTPPLCVGAHKAYPGGGQAITFGFRPRDDQSASTGEEVRAWYEILAALDAYPAPDDPTLVSRTTEYLACAFPNGALALAPHYRLHEETWPGGFFRDPQKDRLALENNPLPDDAIRLENFSLAGQRIHYQGRHALAWRLGPHGELLAFAGMDCKEITLNGRTWRWSTEPVDIAWHPLGEAFSTAGYLPLYRLWCGTAARVGYPLSLAQSGDLELWRGAATPAARRSRHADGSNPSRAGYGLERLSFALNEGILNVANPTHSTGHWLYLVRRKG